MTKIYLMTITKGNDEQDYEQLMNEKIFEKKSDLKGYLNKEGYLKESTYQYVKIAEESIFVAEIQKIKLK
ncbi:hypothetical protein [Lysinibacillus fusiformis]|uniref:hypothetical protein n=1 Tax=Lysinibacillus fusiformis TaxID=28031 RepID=UPI00215A999D|nr:hypothetical protein [Lysinibacillus fusiformis]MCR8852344.1 hypothetical protein [Lysinibacillus fusiformis]WKT78829.1 hypothetical protein QYY55_08440 [Lysinibacillus fusiformis]